MKLTMKHFFILSLFSVAFSCQFPKEYNYYEEAKEQCSKIKSQKEITCYFKGFEMNELEKLTIEERNLNNEILRKITNFKVIYYQESTKEATVLVKEDIYFNRKYVFALEKQHFELSNLKLEPKATFTMTSKNFTCLLNKMDINGVTYERMIEPVFKKK